MLKTPHFLLAGALLIAAPFAAQIPAFPQSVAAAANRTPNTPGLRREAGAWLFNNSMFVAAGTNRGAVGGPVFLPNLRRDKKNKLPLFMPAKNGAALLFSTLQLPDLRKMSALGFDFAGLQAQLAAQVSAARAAGQFYVGWSLPTVPESEKMASSATARDQTALEKAKTAAILKQLRAILDAVAPESALILQVRASDAHAVADIDAVAPACDAVQLITDSGTSAALWPLKMARRVAEEQRDFDLPIFVLPVGTPGILGAANDNSNNTAAIESRLLEIWMAGATGFVLDSAQTPAWASAVTRNTGLFSGAVTLEDAAVLPSLNPRSAELVDQLRAAGRVPLAGRVPDDSRDSDSKGETLLAILDDQTTLETLNALDKAARNGNTIYLEGVPNLQNKALLLKISEMTSTTVEILPARKSEVLTLSDAWLFGDARGREIGVSQRIKWTLKTSLAAQARKKKGEDALEPLSAAKLAGDANGLLVAPLGRGRILWLAHAPLNSRADEAARRDYYASVAGSLQGGLARLEFDSIEAQARNGNTVRFALRASKGGTPIVAVFNDSPSEANVTLSARSDAPVALDLISEREIAAQVSGYSSKVKITVPARGFVWLTFGATRAALDKARLAPLPKARILK